MQAFVDSAKQVHFEGAHTLTAQPLLAGDAPTIAAALRMLQLFEIANFQQNRQLEVMTEDGLVEWCNDVVSMLELDVPELDSFSNPSLRSCTFFLYLFYAISPRNVDIRCVSDGRDQRSAALNARYLLHVLDKLGIARKFIYEQIVHADHELFLLLAMQAYAFVQ